MKRMKVLRGISILGICAGLLLFLYPWISDGLYQHSCGSQLEIYQEEVLAQGVDRQQEWVRSAEQYNKNLYLSGDTPDLLAGDGVNQGISENGEYLYADMLSMNEEGIMGFLEIPTIGVMVPVYHDTSEEVLENGVGHLEGTSLPVGGENTHAVLCGHAGMNTARLLSDLDQLKLGDYFYLTVCDQKLAYEVSSIDIVLPEQTEGLRILPGQDLCTLVTCTPFGVNTHRLLVTGQRTQLVPEQELTRGSSLPEPSTWQREYGKAALSGLGILGLMILLINLIRRIMR